jgi:amphi-Trp domain-containing protein
MPKKSQRDVEKGYAHHQFIAKLRRLADALESGTAFSIMVAGERIRVPAHAQVSVEHERAAGVEELEFQLRWPA